MMNNANQGIQIFLHELKQALQGQEAGLIQDALYDAETHLREAVQENPDTDIQDVMDNFGTAQDIAS